MNTSGPMKILGPMTDMPSIVAEKKLYLFVTSVCQTRPMPLTSFAGANLNAFIRTKPEFGIVIIAMNVISAIEFTKKEINHGTETILQR